MAAKQEPTWSAGASAWREEAIPAARGRRFAVAAGHSAGTEAAIEVWKRTENSADAAVAATLALGVVEPHLFGLGGEVTGIVHIDGRTRVLAGATRAPASMTLKAFRELGVEVCPGDGLLAAGPPAALHALVLVLSTFGSASFASVAEPAIRLAEEGFAVDPGLARGIANQQENFKRLWPSSAAIWTPDGNPAQPGDVIRQPALAETLRRLGRAGDKDGPVGVSTELRTGFVAEALEAFASETRPDSLGGNRGFLASTDLESFEVRWEDAVAWTDHRGWTVCKAGPWSQGPMLLQHLAQMQAGGWDSLPVGDSDYLHATIESLKLAFADREGYFGDPDFVTVPLEALLSLEYVASRAGLVDMSVAGDPEPGIPEPGLTPWHAGATEARASIGDTTHLDIADDRGTLIAFTPSGGWFASPVVPELGFPLGTRCQTFWLDPVHPNVVAPGKRPRTTLTPTLILDGGRTRFALGTPGGDSQDQIQAQMIHALAHGASHEEVVDLPTVVTRHPPSSFFPHGSEDQVVSAESRLGADVLDDLGRRGHRVFDSGAWAHGRPQVLEVTESGDLIAAVSRRVGTGAAAAI